MKKSTLKLAAVISMFLLACNSDCKTDCKSECKHAEPNQDIKDLKVKLEATEAQLLNITAELSKCRGEKIVKIDSTGM